MNLLKPLDCIPCYQVSSVLLRGQVTGFGLFLLQVNIAIKLVTTGKISQDSIVILSPYNAQVSEIRDELKKKNMDQITVTTITKSQGEGMNLLYPQSFS